MPLVLKKTFPFQDLPTQMQVVQGGVAVANAISPGSMTLRDFKEQAEREYVEATLRSFGWNVTRAAAALGIERTNLHKKMKSLGIERD